MKSHRDVYAAFFDNRELENLPVNGLDPEVTAAVLSPRTPKQLWLEAEDRL